MEENNKKERLDMAKFTFPDQLGEVHRTLISQMIADGSNLVEIPGSSGQVIIREKVDGVETSEFNERIAELDIIMLPLKIRDDDKAETFYVCSR